MAAGDIVSVEVPSDGWFADIVIEGLGVGGTYDYGLGANNAAEGALPKLVLEVTSLGFDDAGDATTLVRNVYGTKFVRTPYGTHTVAGSYTSGTFQEGETVTQAVSGAAGIVVIPGSAGSTLYIRAITGTANDSGLWTGGTSGATFTPSAAPADYSTGPREFYDGTNIKVRIALSDFVYAKDQAGGGNSGTDIAATVLGGLYTQGTASNGASVTAANNSTQAYPKVVSNWSWPGYNLLDSSSKLRCVAFHRHAQQGRMVRVVKFSVSDGTDTNTEILLAPVVDSAMADAVPVVEYVTTTDLTSGLTQGAVLTCNYIAYPWVGDSDSILDTSTGTAQPTPLFGPQLNVCNNTGTYGRSYAVVDSVSGNDGTGAVSATFDPGTPPAAYATIGAAYNALRTYNNTNYGRNNGGGSTIYLQAGNHAWVGASVTTGTDPDVWNVITRFPGLAVGDVAINSQSVSKQTAERTKISGVTWTAQLNTGVITGMKHLWIDQCVIDCPTSNQPPFYVNTVSYFTHNTVDNLHMGFRPYSTVNSSPAIIRGNNIPATSYGGAVGYCFIGNERTGGGLASFIPTSMTPPDPDNGVIAFNKALEAQGATTLGTGSAFVATHGLAVVQNLIEFIGTVSFAAMALHGDNDTSTPHNNVLIWNNTVSGQRVNIGYNDSGTGSYLLDFWSVKNNIFEDWNTKHDDFFSSQNGNRVGGWPVLYGVGGSGNLFAEVANSDTAAGDFLSEFPGISTIQNTVAQALGYIEFVDRQSNTGGSAGSGGGDYHLQETSPALGLAVDLVLPYDIEGNSRSGGNAPGAYAFDSGPEILEADGASAGAGEATGAGAAVAGSDGSAEGEGSVSGVAAGVGGSDGAVAASAAVSGTSGAVVCAVGSAAGLAEVNGVVSGVVVIAEGVSAGAAVAAGSGAAIFVGAGGVSGIGVVTGLAASVSATAGAGTGAAAAAGVSSVWKGSAGASAGAATVSGLTEANAAVATGVQASYGCCAFGSLLVPGKYVAALARPAGECETEVGAVVFVLPKTTLTVTAPSVNLQVTEEQVVNLEV